MGADRRKVYNKLKLWPRLITILLLITAFLWLNNETESVHLLLPSPDDRFQTLCCSGSCTFSNKYFGTTIFNVSVFPKIYINHIINYIVNGWQSINKILPWQPNIQSNLLSIKKRLETVSVFSKWANFWHKFRDSCNIEYERSTHNKIQIRFRFSP